MASELKSSGENLTKTPEKCMRNSENVLAKCEISQLNWLISVHILFCENQPKKKGRGHAPQFMRAL